MIPISLKGKAIRSVLWTVLEKWGNRFIQFVIFLVLARLLEPQAFGLVSMAGIFVALVQIFQDQGFSDAIVQRDSLDTEHLDTAFWTNLGVGVFLVLLGFVLADPVAALFGEPKLAPIMRWLSLSFLLGALNGVQKALFRRNLMFGPLAMRTLVSTGVGGIAGIAMAFLGYGVWSLVGFQLASAFSSVLVLWSVSNWRPGFKVSRKHLKHLFSFGINIVAINALGFLNSQSDKFLIGLFLGPTILGYYTIAYRVLTTMSDMFTGIISTVAFPMFSQIQNDTHRMRAMFYRATEASTLLAFPMFLGMTVIARELIICLYGQKWEPSVPILQILSILGIVHALTYIGGAVIKAAGRPGVLLRLRFFNTAMNIVFPLVTVPWGAVGIAFGYVLSGYLVYPFYVYAIRKIINIEMKQYIHCFLVPLISSLCMFSGLIITKQIEWQITNIYILVPFYITIASITYCASVLTLMPEFRNNLYNRIRTLLSGYN
jgi:O-antigen/teichoic acid export membrane protein